MNAKSPKSSNKVIDNKVIDNKSINKARNGKAQGLESLRFDPDAILLRDPGLLLDRHFLGALHAELLDEMDDADADITLFQMGFLNGLQDAYDAVSVVFEERSWSDTAGAESPLLAPPLAIRMRIAVGGDGSDGQRASIAVDGSWPERNEASAVLGALGEPDRPICFLSAGYTSGWLSGTMEADIVAIESNCRACGAPSCEFTAREAAAWRACADPAAAVVLDALPFDELREFVRLNREALQHATRTFQELDDCFSRVPPRGDSERVESIVHIWGPVMVIPFETGDEALKAVDLLGRDPAAVDVSVVVIDLSGAILDHAFGAVALEQTLDMIEAWGAEAILAATTPLSEPVVADLERQPLFVMKDLPSAITAAFQIADAQRRPA